jgi:hypothetical protein
MDSEKSDIADYIEQCLLVRTEFKTCVLPYAAMRLIFPINVEKINSHHTLYINIFSETEPKNAS